MTLTNLEMSQKRYMTILIILNSGLIQIYFMLNLKTVYCRPDDEVDNSNEMTVTTSLKACAGYQKIWMI